MRALAASSDVGAALRHARIFEVLREQELELPQDGQVLAFAEELKREGGTIPVPPPLQLPVPPQGESAPIPGGHLPLGPTRTVPRARRWIGAALVVGAVALAITLRPVARPILAVGVLTDHRADTSDHVASALR